MWKTPPLGTQGHSILPVGKGEPVGKSPFYYAQREQNAVFGRRMSWEQPFHYGDTVAEHHRIREHCGLIDSNSQAKILVTGPNAREAVQRLFTADLNVEIGRGVFSCLCNQQGGAVDDAVVWRLTADQWLCVSSTAGRLTTRDWMIQHIRRWGLAAASVDLTDAICYAAIQGPQSRQVLELLTGREFPNESLPFLSMETVTCAGVECRVGRCGYSGELGYELYIPAQFGEWIWRRASEAVASCGGGPCGIDALVSCGFEKGLTSHGVDYDVTLSPLEGGISFTVCFDKTEDFVGKEALWHIKQNGYRQRVLGFQLVNNEQTAERGASIWSGSEKIGQVRWARHAPTLNVSYGRARLNPEAKIGMHVTIRNEAGPLEAVLHSRYFYDPQHSRLKG